MPADGDTGMATCIESDEEAQRRLQDEYDYYFARRNSLASSSPQSAQHRLPIPQRAAMDDVPCSPTMRMDGDFLMDQPTRRSSNIVPESPNSSFASAASAGAPFLNRSRRYEFEASRTRDLRDDDLARVSPTYSDEDNGDTDYPQQQRYHQSLSRPTPALLARDSRFYERNAPPCCSNQPDMIYPPDLYQSQRSLPGGRASHSLLAPQHARYSMSQRSKQPPHTLKAPPHTTQKAAPPSAFRRTGATAVAKTPTPKTIELSPGVHVLFRGADETWRAVQRDFYTPCHCYGCHDTSEPIFCVQDADFVICPLCKTISPLDDTDADQNHSGGVGLGFTMATLAEIQADVLRARAA